MDTGTETLFILDTGYIVNQRTGKVQNTNENRAGLLENDTVSHINIDVKSITVGTSINLQEEENIGQTQDNHVNVLSGKNDKLTINFIIKRDRQFDAYKYGMINQLKRMEKTDNLKLITMIDNGKNLVNELGRVNIGGIFSDYNPTDADGTVSTTQPYLLGKFKGFSLGDTNKSHYNCSVTFTIEK